MRVRLVGWTPEERDSYLGDLLPTRRGRGVLGQKPGVLSR